MIYEAESTNARTGSGGRSSPELERLWSDLRNAVPGLFLMRGTRQVPGAWSARGTDLDVLADQKSLVEAAEMFLRSLGFVQEWAPESYRRRYCLRRLGSHLANVDLYEAALWGPGFAAITPTRSLTAAEAALFRAIFDKHDLSYFRSRAKTEDLPNELARLLPSTLPEGRAGRSGGHSASPAQR